MIDGYLNLLNAKGGFMELSFKYVEENPGLMLARDYPLGEFQYPCKYNKTMSAIDVEGYKYLPSGDEELLKDAIAALGPISVGIEIAEDFYSYGSGVFDTNSCNGHINHAVLLIGVNLIIKTLNK